MRFHSHCHISHQESTFEGIRRSEISRNPQERECFEKLTWDFEQKLTDLES